MRSKIVLIRHGITTGNVQGLYYGATDVPLADKGIEMTKLLASQNFYPDSENAEYYTSGMLRTEQTFELVYGDKEHEVIENFRELNFGDYEMKSYEELNSNPEYREWCNTFADGTPPPNGESIRDFNARVWQGFEELKVKHELLMLKLRNQRKEAMSICVIHGGVICSIMNSLWPEKYESNFYQWIPNPGHGYVLTMEDGKVVDYEKF
ncbi:MAG: histidine phosphatase family protein [Bacillota bacterium]|nr:histidine phosphatase family protein [Bacillota bacterium]